MRDGQFERICKGLSQPDHLPGAQPFSETPECPCSCLCTVTFLHHDAFFLFYIALPFTKGKENCLHLKHLLAFGLFGA